MTTPSGPALTKSERFVLLSALHGVEADWRQALQQGKDEELRRRVHLLVAARYKIQEWSKPGSDRAATP